MVRGGRSVRDVAESLGVGVDHRVRESWDPKEGSIAPKTRTSARTTPMPEAVRAVLAELRSRRPAAPDSALAYSADDGSPHILQKVSPA